MRPLRNHLMYRESSIGIYAGPSPLALLPAAANPVLVRTSVTDVRAAFVADPFMIRVGGAWSMFFEVMNWAPGVARGEIGLATSPDGLRWTYQRIVLAEPFHLSYPYVFEWNSEHFMIPESSAAGAVRLYRAEPFPGRWVFVKELVTGPALLDGSVFRRDGRWWMLIETSPEQRNDTLRLFQAQDLLGPWREHPRSPVVRSDARTARPAGRVVCTPERLLRFSQDCRRAYGASVSAMEITRLDAGDYQEVPLGDGPILAGAGHGWNGGGMHHVDPVRLDDGRWLACVDGWHERLRSPAELFQAAARRWL